MSTNRNTRRNNFTGRPSYSAKSTNRPSYSAKFTNRRNLPNFNKVYLISKVKLHMVQQFADLNVPIQIKQDSDINLYPVKPIYEEDINNIQKLPLKVDYHFIIGSDEDQLFVIRLTTLDDKKYSCLAIPAYVKYLQFFFMDNLSKCIYLATICLSNSIHEETTFKFNRDVTPVLTVLNLNTNSDFIKDCNKKLSKTPFEVVAGNLYDVTKNNRNKKFYPQNRKPNIHAFTVIMDDSENSIMDLYICLKIKKTCKCESSIIVDQKILESKHIVELQIASKTNEYYCKRGFNTFLRAVTFGLINEQFSKIQNILSHVVNPISAYLLIKYFKATPKNVTQQHVYYNTVKTYIEMENEGRSTNEFLNYFDNITSKKINRTNFKNLRIGNKQIIKKLLYSAPMFTLVSNIKNVIDSGNVNDIIIKFANKMSNKNNMINNIERSRNRS